MLLFVLDQLPHPFAVVTSFPLSAKRSNNAINLIELAPVLAEMFLEISMSFDFSMTREFDWIYTDLTKVRMSTCAVRTPTLFSSLLVLTACDQQ